MAKKTLEELMKEGFTAAGTSSGEHLSRVREMYAELGFEVREEEITPEECGGCHECFKDGEEKIVRLYTRKKQA